MLRALEKMVGLDDAGRPARFWLAPAAVLIATIGAFVLIGEITAAPLYVSVPNGVVIALVMAGLTVACMIARAASTLRRTIRPGRRRQPRPRLTRRPVDGGGPPRAGRARRRRARAAVPGAQQIRGSGSPMSMSTTRVPPNPVRMNTIPSGSARTSPMIAAS